MKKIIKMLTLFSLNGLLISTSVSCTTTNNSSNPGPDPAPPQPPQHDIAFYQAQIKKFTAQINNITNELSQWDSSDNKKAMCGSVTECKEWKMGEIFYRANLNDYNAKIQDANYQILLLENNNNLSPETKKKAKKMLNTQLDFLNKELTFLTDSLVINDATKEIAATNAQIKIVNQLIATL